MEIFGDIVEILWRSPPKHGRNLMNSGHRWKKSVALRRSIRRRPPGTTARFHRMGLGAALRGPDSAGSGELPMQELCSPRWWESVFKGDWNTPWCYPLSKAEKFTWKVPLVEQRQRSPKSANGRHGDVPERSMFCWDINKANSGEFIPSTLW